MSKFLLSLFVVILFVSCHKNGDSNDNKVSICGVGDHSNTCEHVIVTDHVLEFDYRINVTDIFIYDGCLYLEIGISGCDDQHNISLLTNGKLLESFPPQLPFVLLDDNPQDCEAYFTKQYSYSLSSIEALMEGYEEVYLRFDDSDQTFLYHK